MASVFWNWAVDGFLSRSRPNSVRSTTILCSSGYTTDAIYVCSSLTHTLCSNDTFDSALVMLAIT
jgi:hypothetical protein